MIKIYNMENTQTTDNKEYVTGEFRGLSTDSKPTKVGEKYVDNGAVFIEINTGKIYFYDLENTQWREV